MKLLLHACCAPCTIYPIEETKKQNIEVTGFFYNPNIHPEAEYTKRKKEVDTLFKSEDLNAVFYEYDAIPFFDNISKKNTSSLRCPACWNLRLRKTASFAEENGFDAFSTTLLGSPYQNHEIIKKICEDISQETKSKFYYKDFRIGFKDAHKKAKGKGMYCQNYCGCVFSMIEREEARKSKKEKLHSPVYS